MIPLKMLKKLPKAIIRKLKTGRYFKTCMLEVLFDDLEQYYEETLLPSLDPRVHRILTSEQSKITLDTSPHLKKIARERQEICIDPTRCIKPGLCLKCQKVCSYKVIAYTWDPFLKWGDFTELAQRKGRMFPTHTDLCTSCNKCVETCPEKAITITPGVGTKAAPQVEEEKAVTSTLPGQPITAT
jgi:formate hydrogenlyase subunit 6/NADH:ubiquinone oxidoreductase subunit I